METLRNMKTRRFRLEKRTVFFQGTAFVIEEEISINSDDDPSVVTSDDSYLTDDSGVKEEYLDRIEEKKLDMEPEDAKNLLYLEKNLEKNRPNQMLNLFLRRQTYIIASFNDWTPLEMKTAFEIKSEKTNTGHGEFKEFL